MGRLERSDPGVEHGVRAGSKRGGSAVGTDWFCFGGIGALVSAHDPCPYNSASNKSLDGRIDILEAFRLRAS